MAVAKIDLFPAVGVFPGINSINNKRAFNIETDTVFSDSESMGSGRDVDEWFGKMQRVARGNIKSNLFNNSFLQLGGEFLEFPFATGGEFNIFKHQLNYDNPNSCLIFSKGTNPNFLASFIPSLSFNTNFGLMGRWASMASISQPIGLWNTYSLEEAVSSNLASKAQSKSHSEYVSNIKYLGEPFLSTMAAALKSLEKASPDFLSSLGIFANFSNISNFTCFLADNLTNGLDFISLFPPYNTKYTTSIFSLSRFFFSEVQARGASNWFISKYKEKVEILPIEINLENAVEGLTKWENKKFSSSLRLTGRIIPDGVMEGFFVAKIKKISV